MPITTAKTPLNAVPHWFGGRYLTLNFNTMKLLKMTTEDFLNKLKSLTFKSYEGSDKLITDLKTGLTLSYYTTKNDGKPQIVMYISDTKTNAHLQSWGAENLEDNNKIIDFFVSEVSKLIELPYKQKEKGLKAQREAKAKLIKFLES